MKKSRYWRVPSDPTGLRLRTGVEEYPELGIVDLGRSASRKLLEEWEPPILSARKPLESGGAVDRSCLPLPATASAPFALPLLGIASTVLSSLKASNVFVATADPAILMKIGRGVSSAITRPNGEIIGHAPFISAGSAILPVMAPMIFLTTASTIMISVRLDAIQRELRTISNALQDLLRREIAGDYGALLSAARRLEDLRSEFEGSRRFTDDMKVRLALVEGDIGALRYKSGILAQGNVVKELNSRLFVSDLGLLLLSSVMDIHVADLRLKLAAQDNTLDLRRRGSELNDRIACLDELRKTDPLELLKDHSERSPSSPLPIRIWRWWTRKFTDDELKELRGQIERDLKPLYDRIEAFLGDLKAAENGGSTPSVVYYRARGWKGDLRAYYTSDLRIAPP